MLQSPTLALQEQEARALTERICDVADYYKVDLLGETTGPWMLWIGLIGTVGMIYVPKIKTIVVTKRANKAAGQKIDFGADQTPNPNAGKIVFQ